MTESLLKRKKKEKEKIFHFSFALLCVTWRNLLSPVLRGLKCLLRQVICLFIDLHCLKKKERKNEPCPFHFISKDFI